MKKISLILLCMGLLQFCFIAPSAAFEGGVALIVNDKMISEMQVNDRFKLITSSSGMPNNATVRARLMPQITEMLVLEEIKRQEAQRAGIEVTEEEIETGFAQIASQNKFTAAQFESLLKKQNIPRRTLDDQIGADIAWVKYVEANLRPQIQITDYDIDAELARLQNNPKFADNMPSRDQVLNKLGSERLARLQARHLQDLKAEAFIETRG